MNIFSKIVGQNSETLLGKAMETFKKDIGPLSFIVYMIPIMVLIIIYESNNPGSINIPTIYSVLIMWYFIALFLLNKIKLKNKIITEFIQMVICLPIYLSVAITFISIKLFINKKKYPDVTEDKLPLVQRNFKLKKLKRKMKRNNSLFNI